MAWPRLEPESLNVWIFGPGVGELIVAYAPPGAWMVLDGCGIDGDGVAQRLLDHYEATPRLVLLSHPHLDHASGLREVIEASTANDPATWPRIGMVPAPNTRGAGDTWDAEAALDGGLVEQVVATILDRWQRAPACRWDLELGSVEPLGEATVRILSPAAEHRSDAVRAWLQQTRHDYNKAATAVLLQWRGRRLLLGSDLVEEPGRGWTSAMLHDHDLRAHDVYKIAHHGSGNALGPQTEPPKSPAERLWVGTPFSRKGLPRFEDGEGLSVLLDVEAPIELTGLPIPFEDQSVRTEDVWREALRTTPDGGFANRGPEFPACYVHLLVREEGPVAVERGPGAVRVRR